MTSIETLAWLEPLKAEAIGLLFSLLGAVILALFRPRVKLIYGRANNSLNHVTVPDPNDEGKNTSTEIYVDKFFLQNNGRQTATNIDFVLSDWPGDIRVWQPRDVEYKTVDRGDCLISIPRIAPRELVIIDCVYINQQAAWITSVKCSEAIGKEVPFQTIRKLPGWAENLFLLGLLLGFAYLIQVTATALGLLQ